MPTEVCPICAGMDDPPESWTSADGVPMLTCRSHPEPYSWAAYVEPEGKPGREGFGNELGIYESLPLVLRRDEPFVEYGVVEHRWALANPQEYTTIVERYGHTAIAPTQYSASAFLARALGTLWREGTVGFRAVKATGRWSYNSEISGWCLPGTPAESSDEVLSWHDFAVAEGFDPESWPALQPGAT